MVIIIIMYYGTIYIYHRCYDYCKPSTAVCTLKEITEIIASPAAKKSSSHVKSRKTRKKRGDSSLKDDFNGDLTTINGDFNGDL